VLIFWVLLYAFFHGYFYSLFFANTSYLFGFLGRLADGAWHGFGALNFAFSLFFRFQLREQKGLL
jgi:hypothetical protein